MRQHLRIVALLLVSCADDDAGDDGPPAPVTLTTTLGGLEVRLEADPPRLVVHDAAGGALVEAVGFAVGRADVEVVHLFGSFKFAESGRVTSEVASLAAAEVVGDELRFGLLSDSGAELGTGVVRASGEGSLALILEAEGENRVSARFACGADEHFLGFGGQSFDVDHRGQRIAIWVQEDGVGKTTAEDDDYDPAWMLIGRRHSTHTPMPMFVSSGGYAMLLDTPARSIFDMCKTDEREIAVEVWDARFDLTIHAAETPAIAVEKLTGSTGRPAMPPAYTFAPWIDAMFGSANVRRIAAKLRAASVPVSVIWTEDWRGGDFEGAEYVLQEDWELDRDLYPDFEDLAGDLHDHGFKFLVYQNSFLTASVPVYEEAVAGGYTIHDASGEPYLFEGSKFEPASMLDLSNPDAVAWAKEKYREAFTAGADGYMADFAEWLPTDAVLASGEDALLAHNLYPLAWQRLHQELTAGSDALYFVRSAYLGSQPLVQVVWAGDQQTDWTEGDGFPSVIPIGIGLGMTGFPFYGHDIGGYTSNGAEPTTKELWYRWVTLGALSPVMRTHHGRKVNENWSWEKDTDATSHFGRWASLHIRLFPYLHALAEAATQTGAPLFRPLAFDYPDFAPGWTSKDQYMLGSRLLVAPVITEGAESRTVQLPPGRFFPLLGGQAVEGEIQVAAGITEIPVFVPAGTLLVTLPDVIDTLVDVNVEVAPELATLSSVGETRELWAWPGGGDVFREAGGVLRYEWDGVALVDPPTLATWNGEAAEIAPDGSITVRGEGELVINEGQARLTLTGGALDRQVVVRLFGL